MPMPSPLIFIHICGATIGLLSGTLAMFFRKGSGLHAAAGNVFFISMLAMSSSGAYIAQFMRPNKANFLVAVLTFYLVSTAWVAARRRDGKPGLFDWLALLVVLAEGASGVVWGLQAAVRPRGVNHGMSSPGYFFVIGSIALLCAALDVRMIRRGGFVGGKRIFRHLARMCSALLLTTFSFYPGQAKLFPVPMRTSLLYVPHILFLGIMIFWMVRVRSRERKLKTTKTYAAPLMESPETAWPVHSTSAAHH